MSGWLLLGLPGLAYASMLGAAEAIWTAIGLALGTYINWLIVAKPLRNYSERVGALTIPELQKKAVLTLVSATSITEGGAHDVIHKEKSTTVK